MNGKQQRPDRTPVRPGAYGGGPSQSPAPFYPAGGRGRWIRTRRGLLCPVCQHRNPSGCSISPDGRVVVCIRIQSTRPTGLGWVHFLYDRDREHWPRRVTLATVQPAARADLPDLARKYAEAVDPAALGLFAKSLGVTSTSLRMLSVGRDERGAWTFPMIDGGGRVVGIRLRKPSGQKLAVKGGREGLFIPETARADDGERLLIAEGATDAAALLDLGFRAIGRPSCLGGVRQLIEYVRLHSIGAAVIVADADPPGQRGAAALAAVLVAYCRDVRIIAPPDGVKDARVWKQAGATRADVLAAIAAARAWRVAVRRTAR